MSAAVALHALGSFENLAPVRLRSVLHEASRREVDRPSRARQDRCLGEGLDTDAMRQVNAMLTTRIRLRKGETLFRPGERFKSLYAIRLGSCKTVALSADGKEQVAGYHMSGELIGADGIGTGSHDCQAIALEDTEVCILPFERIEALSRQDSSFQHKFYQLLSRENGRVRMLLLLLGTMRAEQRLATFLLDLSERYQARGFSSCEFVLRMTREEIGSYLGLKLETISRLFSRFQREGLLQVEGRVVKLLDRASVKRLVEYPE
jgi:CRP/FNR family transcriptional regulator